MNVPLPPALPPALPLSLPLSLLSSLPPHARLRLNDDAVVAHSPSRLVCLAPDGASRWAVDADRAAIVDVFFDSDKVVVVSRRDAPASGTRVTTYDVATGQVKEVFEGTIAPKHVAFSREYAAIVVPTKEEITWYDVCNDDEEVAAALRYEPDWFETDLSPDRIRDLVESSADRASPGTEIDDDVAPAVSDDGFIVAYAALHRGDAFARSVVVRAVGGEPYEVHGDAHVKEISIANTATMLVRTNDGIVVYERDRRVGVLPGTREVPNSHVRSMSVSADGQFALVQWSSGFFLVYALREGLPKSGVTMGSCATFSRDGTKIAFLATGGTALRLASNPLA